MGPPRSANDAFATSALYGRAGPVTFGIAPKVTKSASPCTPLHPAVLATGGMRRTAHESFANATHSVCRRRIYDRPLLRSSARAEGALELMFDRFAMDHGKCGHARTAVHPPFHSLYPLHHGITNLTKTIQCVTREKCQLNSARLKKYTRNASIYYVRRHGMQILFIDQNKWIDLARAASGKPEGAAYVEIYRALSSAVDSGQIILPLTIAHIIETAKRNDPESRLAVARVQAQLSKGSVYRSRKARLLVEMRNSLHRVFSEPEVELPDNWAIVRGFMQAFEPFDTLTATPEQARTSNLINQFLDPEFQYVDYMRNQDDEKRRRAVEAFTAESASLLARIEERRSIMAGSNVDLRYRAYSAKLFLDHQGFVAHMLEVIGHTVDDMKALGDKAILDFMKGVPTLNVEAEVAARLEIQEGALEPNDIRDVQSFYTAIPYSSRLVAERNFTSLARQAKLDSKYGVSLHTNLNELASAVE